MEYVKIESITDRGYRIRGWFLRTRNAGNPIPSHQEASSSGPAGVGLPLCQRTPRTHQALMAAPSIGSYFGQNIKAHPEQYPYTKVEADRLRQYLSATSDMSFSGSHRGVRWPMNRR